MKRGIIIGIVFGVLALVLSGAMVSRGGPSPDRSKIVDKFILLLLEGGGKLSKEDMEEIAKDPGIGKGIREDLKRLSRYGLDPDDPILLELDEEELEILFGDMDNSKVGLEDVREELPRIRSETSIGGCKGDTEASKPDPKG